MNVIDWSGFGLGFYKERLLDWSASVLFGRLPLNSIEIFFAQIGQIFFAGFLGVLSIYMLLKVIDENYLLKGWVFGIVIWFGLYAISTVFKLPGLEKHTINATISHFISASTYGLVLSFVMHALDKRMRI